MERLGYPKHLGHYGFSAGSIPLVAAKLLAEAAFPLNEKGESSLVHSFFWSAQRYNVPWIHENDQSLGQYLSDYIHFDGMAMRSMVSVSSNMLNSKNCKAVIAWSEWARKGYIRDGVEQSKIHVIPPAFVPSCDPRRRSSPAVDSVNVLFIGRDYDRKGGDTALEIFDKLKVNFGNARLVFVGPIKDKRVLQKIKQDRRITHYDYVSKELLHQHIFPSADIFLLPTKSEAYGMSILEAMSRGIPVVTSRISAIPEIVEDGVSGYLRRPGDVDSYLKACALLLESRERRMKMGENARSAVSEKFSPQKIGNELYELYTEVLS